MASAIQNFAEGCADDLGRANESSELMGAVDWTKLIEMFMQLALSMLGMCSNSDAKIVAAMKSPGPLQKGFLGREIKTHCEVCGTSRWRGDVGEIRTTILARTAAADDATLIAMLSEARGIDNSPF